MSRILVLALFLAGAACTPAGLGDGEPLFRVKMVDDAGRLADLGTYRGQPLLVNFWASWCSPCRAEVPELTRVAKQRQGDGLRVIGVGVGETLESAREFAEALKIEYPLLLSADKSAELMRALGNDQSALPYTVAIDRRGRIAGRKLGLMRSDEADALATAALGSR